MAEFARGGAFEAVTVPMGSTREWAGSAAPICFLFVNKIYITGIKPKSRLFRMASFLTRSTPSVTKKDKQVAKMAEQVRSLRARVRESGEAVQEVALTSAGAFGAPYLANKFLGKDASGSPVLFGMPATAVIGALAIGVGTMADSEPISNVGKGALYAAAAELGTSLAKK